MLQATAVLILHTQSLCQDTISVVDGRWVLRLSLSTVALRPKEVWALITLMLYIYPLLHLADDSRPAKFHIYCVLAFLSVVITYFGVNFILGGIHAYN